MPPNMTCTRRRCSYGRMSCAGKDSECRLFWGGRERLVSGPIILSVACVVGERMGIVD